MALTLSITAPVQTIVANQTMNFIVTVTNAGAAAVTLQSLGINEITESDAQLSQPLFMTPNVPVGVGNPVLSPATSYNYPFQCVFNSPVAAGPSPQNPGGAAPASVAQTPDPYFTLQAQSQSSDGTIASTSLMVSVQSLIAPFPPALGGALQLAAGANLLNFLTM